MTNTKRSDEVYLEEIENLSKKISDLINIGKYEDITVIDKKRLELIKKFNEAKLNLVLIGEKSEYFF